MAELNSQLPLLYKRWMEAELVGAYVKYHAVYGATA